MNRDEIISFAVNFTDEFKGNLITEENAISPDCVGLRLFDPPIFAFGSPFDKLYEEFKSTSIIGGHFLPPVEWLPGVKTVIAFFLPYTKSVKTANSIDQKWPSDEWLHGRYEGQVFLKELIAGIEKLISDAGYKSLTPTFDTRYKVGIETDKNTSNWSERHVAFACGLGTFGLSAGLITDMGVCGRIGCIITELELPKDERRFERSLEYCKTCGACIKKCPSKAISFEGGKNNTACSELLGKTYKKHKPRYGCGKCQTKVPCESVMPRKLG